MTPIVNSSPKTARRREKKSFSWPKLILWQFLLLVLGSSLAFSAGIILGVFNPQTEPEKPVVAKIWRWLQQSEGSVIVSPNSTSGTNYSQRLENLTVAEKEKLAEEMRGLQAQLNSLDNRIGQIETDLGVSRSDRSLRERIQSLQESLQSDSPSQQVSVLDTANSSSKNLKVTLPSDLLFKGRDSNLAPEAQTILDQVVEDLSNSEGETVSIAVHTDTNKSPEENRELSFRRAQTIGQYLTNVLGEKYRVVTVGYGETRPLADNSSETNQQVNRRVEIEVR